MIRTERGTRCVGCETCRGCGRRYEKFKYVCCDKCGEDFYLGSKEVVEYNGKHYCTECAPKVAVEDMPLEELKERVYQSDTYTQYNLFCDLFDEVRDDE